MKIVNFLPFRGLPLIAIASILFWTPVVGPPDNLWAREISVLGSTALSDPVIKEIREDVRRTIYVVQSWKDPSLLPELKFYAYRIGKDDTFWKIMANTSSNIDTLMTVNGLGTSADIVPGRTIYVPNMRGIIFHNKSGAQVEHLARAFKVGAHYILQANGNSIRGKEYIFIPGAGISTIERSLFLGTGFITPLVNARKTSGFGLRRDPFTREIRFHGGVDLACRPGTKIYAARSGVVCATGYKGGYGLTVEVAHSHGYKSIYGHLSRIHVRPDQRVTTTTLLGLSGNTGRSTGPHLHFEVRRNSRPVNPFVLSRQ